VAGIEVQSMRLMAEINTSPNKMRRDFCQAIEVVFSLPLNTAIDLRRYFSDCAAWCAARFGQDNILSADVHLDESAPHCHVLIAPIQDGRWVGGKLIDRSNTHALRESFKRNVANGYGLRMVDKMQGTQKANAIVMVLKAIEAGHREVIAMPLWQPLRQSIERDPAPFVAALGLMLGEKTPAKPKTMAQIFTSTGKGPKRETLHLPKTKPIGIDRHGAANIAAPMKPIGIVRRLPKPITIADSTKNNQSLSCVGFASPEYLNGLADEQWYLNQAAHQRDDGYTVERDFDTASVDVPS